MKTAQDIRSAYLAFLKKQGHAIIPSSSLVPDNDPTTLFTGSGMQPMVPYLLGEPHPKGKRIADSQKCFRSQDIEEVGDNRHTTYFEMLGNWSLGDYFKKEQLRWFFEFLTKEVKLDPQKLYVTVFAGNTSLSIPKDTESVAIWKQLFEEVGIPATVGERPEQDGLETNKIFYYDETKNWWSRAGEPKNMPVGEPGGPDSEVFYDFGAELQLHENSEFAAEPCHVNCDCGRFLEIGNSVFMQYQKQEDGSFTELPQKNVDFGGGLERIAAAKSGNPDVFTTDLFMPVIKKLESLTQAKYGSDPAITRSYRVIADHVRAAVMLAADGVVPDNKEQGYFSRRLLRRAIRFGMMIGIQSDFLSEMVAPVVKMYEDEYPEVAQKQAEIEAVFSSEDSKFRTALQKGMRHLEKQSTLDGSVAFYLYETYGFPFELTQEIAAERGVRIDTAAFEEAKRAHSEASRKGSEGRFKGGLQDTSERTVQFHTATHLLHAALRSVLGTHVQQKGSNITADRLRFDFTHQEALTEDQKEAVVEKINSWIDADLPVSRSTMKKDAALKAGALAFFGEKYPDEVSVYTIGKNEKSDWISKELCGGPHVSHTGEIPHVVLKKEKASSAGVRRVYLEVVE